MSVHLDHRALHVSTSMKPVTFLDFDNLLAVHKLSDSFRVLDAAAMAIIDAFPDLWLNVFDAKACRNLQALHNEFEPSYVISSLWASHLSLEQMEKMLKRCGLKFVALNLCEHWCTPRSETSSRLSEIEAWLHLQAWKEAPAYVILDDHASAGGLSGSWLEDKTVFCDAWVGFSDAKLSAAREILLSQRR
jgi:hypothetical protein